MTNEGHFYIGMDSNNGQCVVTDRNPHLEGLLDIHRCIYLPSSFEKNQTLPGYLTQVRRLTHHIAHPKTHSFHVCRTFYSWNCRPPVSTLLVSPRGCFSSPPDFWDATFSSRTTQVYNYFHIASSVWASTIIKV